MILEVWFDSTQQPFESDPANKGWDDIKAFMPSALFSTGK